MNLALFEYSLSSLIRNPYKNLFLFFILTFLTFLLASIFFITTSMKYELAYTLDALPEIIVQNRKAGMPATVDETIIETILEIEGVKDALSRVWGYYYFDKEELYFSLVGVDIFEPPTRDSLTHLPAFDDNSMLIGEGVAKVLQESYYRDYFNFIKADGEIIKLTIAATLDRATSLESSDMILLSKERARDIFGFREREATDIAVFVTNPTEVPMVALKITEAFPNYRVITKEDMRVSYETIFNYKSGLFLGLFTISFFTFFIIIYDRATGVSSEQKREIGVLKALGWRVKDILSAKLYEASILSGMAYILGITLSVAYVYILDAPLLRDIFIGYSQVKPHFELIFTLDISLFALLFFLSVVPYIGATIIPSWRVASLDADEVMR